MKILAPILTIFALLTDPSGGAIYVVKSQVIAISEPLNCTADAHAKVFTSAGNFCVAEDPPDVATKVNKP